MRLFWELPYDYYYFFDCFWPICVDGSLRLLPPLNSSRASLAGPLDWISPEATFTSNGFSPLLAKACSGVKSCWDDGHTFDSICFKLQGRVLLLIYEVKGGCCLVVNLGWFHMNSFITQIVCVCLSGVWGLHVMWCNLAWRGDQSNIYLNVEQRHQ